MLKPRSQKSILSAFAPPLVKGNLSSEMREAPVEFRAAHQEDAEEIAALHGSWALADGSPDLSRGFLLMGPTTNEIARRMAGHGNLIVVALFAGKLAGFLVASSGLGGVAPIKWERTADVGAADLADPDHRHVLAVAVDRLHQRQGLGLGMYRTLEGLAKPSFVSAFIAVSPLRNASSLSFHARLGFQRVARFRAESFCSLRGYRSELWAKKIR